MSPVIVASVGGGPSSPAIGQLSWADASPSRVLDLRASDGGVFVIDAGGRVKGLAARFLRTRCVRGTCVVFRQHSGRGRATNGRPDSSARCERTKEGRPESRRLDLGVCTRRIAFDTPPSNSRIARFGPTSMRKPLSRPERDDCGTSQASIRRHPRWRSAMRGYAVAPIQYRGVAMRHVGPRDAT
jgi:hypothetical protein